MKKFLASLVLCIGILGLIPSGNAQFKPIDPTLEFFYGETCPHCKNEKKWFPELKKMYPNVIIEEYEVWYNAENNIHFRERLRELGKTSSGVPTNIIKNDVIVGFNPEAILESLEKNYGPPSITKEEIEIPKGASTWWKRFLDTSWPVMSLILGLLDGFNPCAMWTLFILLGFLMTMDDHRKKWLVGIVFVGSSAVIYFIALLAYLLGFEGIAAIVNGPIMGWVFRLVGLMAVITGIVALMNGFKKKVDCEVRDAESRKKFKDKLSEILNREKIYLILIGMVGLAFSVNMIELLCSFAIPTTFTTTLVALKLPFWEQIIGLILYTITYILDDVIVLTIALWTMNLKILSNKVVQYSHIIGGLLILILGLFLLFDPNMLDVILFR